MFDDLVTATTGTHGASAVDAWARVENAACAQRLAAMVTMLDDAYAASGSHRREHWRLDNWAAVSAHIGATQRLAPGTAANQLKYPRFCSYVVARAGVGWLAGGEAAVRAASYSAGER